MSTHEVVVPDHPSKFSRKIIDVLRTMIADECERAGALAVLDPFAGVGTIHELADDRIATYGVELQPEWAAAHPATICGSVLDVAELLPVPSVNVLATSPTYGNRMADSHDARERCSACDGQGCEEGCGSCSHAHDGPDSHKVCNACGGAGVRDHHRNTYTHTLRRSGVEPVVSDDNAMQMQWGARYRSFHDAAWRACDRVLAPGALVLLNVKNHVRTIRGEQSVQRVVEYHVNSWLLLGYTIEEARRIETRGLAYGANHDVRTPAELIVSLRKPL